LGSNLPQLLTTERLLKGNFIYLRRNLSFSPITLALLPKGRKLTKLLQMAAKTPQKWVYFWLNPNNNKD